MKIERLTTLVSLGGFVLASFGALRLYIYYDTFFINIFSFISLGELVVESISVTIQMIFTYIVVTVLLILTLRTGHWPVNFEGSFKEKLLRFAKKQPIVSAILFVTVLLHALDLWQSTFQFFNAVDHHAETRWTLIILGMFPLLAPFALYKYSILMDAPRPGPIACYIAYIFCLTCFDTVNDAVKEVNSVMKEPYFSDVDVYLKDGTIIEGSDSIYYIGQTERFLFIHNYYQVTSDAYPLSEVEKIGSY